MSGRRLVLLAGLAAGLILCTGCQGRPNPGATPTPPAAANTSGHAPLPGRNPTLARQRANREASRRSAGRAGQAGTADFTRVVHHNGRRSRFATPGGRNEEGPRRDLTSQVQWTAEPAGLVEIEPGGYLRPIGARRRDGQGRARRSVGHGADHARTAVDSVVGFRRGHRADLHPAGLQHGGVPRQGRRPERLSSLALRLRPGRRLSSPGA